MKHFLFTLLMLSGCFARHTIAQSSIVYRQPVVQIDFGSNSTPGLKSAGSLKNYVQIDGTCPDDGAYSFQSHMEDCFGGNWITMPEDHTPGDQAGKMMIVNASEKPGLFFAHGISGLKPGAHYEFAVWMVNVCYRGAGCFPTPPTISISIECNGVQLARFRTGEITAMDNPNWQRYYGQFTMPPVPGRLDIIMSDDTQGGCGNDFAMDDLSIREFEYVAPPKPTAPVKVPAPKPVVKPVPKPPAKPLQPVPVRIPAKQPVAMPEKPAPAIPQKEVPIVRTPAAPVKIPAVLTRRSNPVVKSIETNANEMLVELYDNGEVDGDTVSIYHNNELIVSRAGISEKPVSFKIKVNKMAPHHELIMVADNLGSIPPNTSLMIITAGEKRYEMFISSSNEKNAKIVIDLKE